MEQLLVVDCNRRKANALIKREPVVFFSCAISFLCILKKKLNAFLEGNRNGLFGRTITPVVYDERKNIKPNFIGFNFY